METSCDFNLVFIPLLCPQTRGVGFKIQAQGCPFTWQLSDSYHRGQRLLNDIFGFGHRGGSVRYDISTCRLCHSLWKLLDPPYEIKVSRSTIATPAASEILETFTNQSAAVYGFENCTLSGDASLAQEETHFTSTAAFGVPFGIGIPVISILVLFFIVLRYKKRYLGNATANKELADSTHEISSLKTNTSSKGLMYFDRKADLEQDCKHEIEAITRLRELDGGNMIYELCSTTNGGPTKLSSAHVHELGGAEFCEELDDALHHWHFPRLEKTHVGKR